MPLHGIDVGEQRGKILFRAENLSSRGNQVDLPSIVTLEHDNANRMALSFID